MRLPIEKHPDKELPLEQIKAEASKQLPGMMAQIIENVYSKEEDQAENFPSPG